MQATEYVELTQEEFEAIKQHRVEFLSGRRARPVLDRFWRDQLTTAWLNDWPEQWGLLRTIRNKYGIAEAFELFDRMESRL